MGLCIDYASLVNWEKYDFQVFFYNRFGRTERIFTLQINLPRSFQPSLE
jgi:hypothetical protein